MALFTRRADKADALAEVPLFAGLSRKHLMEVARHTDELTLPAGEVLTEQGEMGREAFLIVKGTVTVSKDGRELAVSGPGDVIGEMSLLDRQPRSATCVANEECVVLVMSTQDFTSLLDEVPGLSRKLLVTLSQRLRAAQDQLD